MTTIIFSHPWHGSFNKAILDKITSKLEKSNKPFQIIDLNKDNFDPTLNEKNLKVYSRGETKDPLVEEYQKKIKESEELIFVFPIWWSGLPAILHGFFDKVFLVHFSHNYNNGWTGLLNINKCTIVTTSESPTDWYKKSIEEVFIGQMLAPVGIKNSIWMNCEKTSHGTKENREEFLKKVENHF